MRTGDGSSRVSYAVATYLRADAGLWQGDVADGAALAALQERSEVQLAQRRGLAFLARAMHSRQALALKLRRAGFGAPALAQAMARLEELGYLDDAGFARMWVRGRVERGGDGRAKVLAGLLSRGISQPEAQAALEAEYPRPREAEICQQVAQRLAARLTPDSGGGERVARQLAQRGFPGHHIVQALQLRELSHGSDGAEF